MEFQVLKRWWIGIGIIAFASSCEKEIKVDLPPVKPELVVEACVNDSILSLNYVFLSQVVDFFNPDLSLIGLNDAEVYISEGEVHGNDTVYNQNRRFRFTSQALPNYPSGLYTNPTFIGRSGMVYKLEITYQDKHVEGITSIPSRVPITGLYTQLETEVREEELRERLFIKFFDPPGPSYYRIAATVDKIPTLLLGFGEAYRLRRTEDNFVDNMERTYDMGTFSLDDTVSVYLCRLGAKEYRFWQSFAEAQNNDGPFSTPVQLISNVKGGIGSFTGYSISYKQWINTSQ